MRAREVVHARGHYNVRAVHRTTIEITKEEHLTTRGDCIVGVAADKSASDLSEVFKALVRRPDSVVFARFTAGGVSDVLVAQGHPGLVLSDDKKIIIRRSEYIEPATIGVRANKAARDLRRDLVEALRRGAELVVELVVLTLDEVYSEHAGSRAVL